MVQRIPETVEMGKTRQRKHETYSYHENKCEALVYAKTISVKVYPSKLQSTKEATCHATDFQCPPPAYCNNTSSRARRTCRESAGCVAIDGASWELKYFEP